MAELCAERRRLSSSLWQLRSLASPHITLVLEPPATARPAGSAAFAFDANLRLAGVQIDVIHQFDQARAFSGC